MRIDRSIGKVAVMVAIGVTEEGHITVLGLQFGDKESASSWREFIKDLKRRGVDAGAVSLVVMDEVPGLERVFKMGFKGANVQRYQIHVARNVLTKVPRKLKKDIPDEIRTIFYASNRKKTIDF